MKIKDGVLVKVYPEDIIDGSFVIPESVTEIEQYAFRDCSSLTKVEIPNSVTEIGECAFFRK